MALSTIEMKTIDTDVLVVGSGISGSAAAMKAAKGGARTVLLEKQDTFGGSAALSAGMFWTAPSIESFQARIPLGNVVLGRRLVNDFTEALSELRASGARVADHAQHNILTFGIGYSMDIQAILRWCREELAAAGGHAKTGETVVELLNDGRRVTGAVSRGADGNFTRYAAGAVVLAGGGFQGAPEELARYIGPNADRLVLRSNPGSIGDGLRLARSAGAGGTKAMGTFYGHLLPFPLHRFRPEDYLPYSQYYSESTILVNLRGERFTDETGGDELLNQEVTFQPQARGVLLFDEHVRCTEGMEEPFPGLGAIDRFAVAVEAGGTHAVAHTLPELLDEIARWGIDRRNLENTLNSYIAAISEGGGSSLGVPVSTTARAPQTGPFYALMVQPSITFTFGGIRTNADGEVLNHDGCQVPGLYAAGADIGGLFNYGYAGGLAPGYITGRWAGSSAAHYACSLPGTPAPSN